MQGRKNQYSQDLNNYDFKKIIKNEKNIRTKTRLLILQQIKEGKSITETAKIFGNHYQTIRRWLMRLKKEGLKGLEFKTSPGRKRKFTEDEAFKKAVLKLQANRSGGTIKGLDVLKMMEERFGVKICLNSIYSYLKRANLVWITGRSKNPNMDKEAQASFKKNLERS